MQTDKTNRNSMNHSGIVKLPPQALDLEEALLGSILLNKESFGIATEIINYNCFYKDTHQKIFKACENMYNKSQPIDLLTVPVELKLMGDLETIGGQFALMDLTDKVSREIDVEFCAKIIYQKFLQREMIRVSTETISQAYEETTDVFELIEKNQSDVFGLAGVGNKKDVLGIDSLVTDCIEYLKTPSVGGLTGIGTGFKDVDKITGG
jgi:replicative DNA helicase